jgi:hypothetical protein
MRKSLITTAGLAAASLATIGGLTGCGVGHSRAADAAAIVKADGYPVTSQPSGQLLPKDVISEAEGVQGSMAEVVIIAATHTAGEGLVTAFQNAGLVNTGLTGNVVKIVATTQQLAASGTYLNNNTAPQD